MTTTRSLWSSDPPELYWANLLSTEKIIINQGGTSSGKTYCILQVLISLAIANRDYVITVVSNTVPKLKEDSMRAFAMLLNLHPTVKRFIKDFNKSERVYTFTNGSIIEFKSFEDADQAQGGKRQILYINEASRVEYMIFFEAQLRTSTKTFIDYNPTETFWVHHKVINSDEYPSKRIIRSWHIHNPYLSQEQRDAIERIKDPELWKVYARGLTGKLQGAVYSWQAAPVPDKKDVKRVVWGLDFGYTNDPTCLTKIYQMISGPFDYIVQECCYMPGISPPGLKDILIENGYNFGEMVYCDHDKEQVMQLRRLGISAVNAQKGEILNRILYVKSLSIAYTENSPNIPNELNMYRFIEIDGKATNKPIDAHNHAMDSAGYGIYSHRNRRK